MNFTAQTCIHQARAEYTLPCLEHNIHKWNTGCWGQIRSNAELSPPEEIIFSGSTHRPTRHVFHIATIQTGSHKYSRESRLVLYSAYFRVNCRKPDGRRVLCLIKCKVQVMWRWNKETHPLELVDVLLHRQSVQSTGDAQESSQETRSKTQLRRHGEKRLWWHRRK